MIFWILLILFIAILVYYQKEYEDNSKFAQFFDGIINKREYKIYIVFLFIRRLAFVAILIFMTPISSFTSICMLLPLQVIYMGILVTKRPYTEVKANIIEIINETYFITILSLLWYRIRRCLVPLKNRHFTKLRGGLDSGDFYFLQILLKNKNKNFESFKFFNLLWLY